MKIDRLKKCYAFDMPSDEYEPSQVAAGLTKVTYIFRINQPLYFDFRKRNPGNPERTVKSIQVKIKIEFIRIRVSKEFVRYYHISRLVFNNYVIFTTKT